MLNLMVVVVDLAVCRLTVVCSMVEEDSVRALNLMS